MTEPVAQTQQEAAPSIDADATFEARIAATIEQLGGQSEENDNAEPEAETPKLEARAVETDKPANDTTAPDPDAERKERLARIQEMEREQYKKSARVVEREKKLEAEAKALAERHAKLEQLEKVWNDPGALLEALEAKVGPERLSQWILDQADPSKKAELAAKRAATPIEEKLQKLEEENRKFREQLEADKRAAEERAAFEQAATLLSKRVEEVNSEAPLVARFFAKRRDAALTMADQIARSFHGQEFNTDDVIIRMQQVLAADAEIFTDPQANGSTAAPSREQSISAAAKATTISNRAAAERSSLVTEDESDLPLEERTRRLERRLKAVK